MVNKEKKKVFPVAGSILSFELAYNDILNEHEINIRVRGIPCLVVFPSEIDPMVEALLKIKACLPEGSGPSS